MNNAFAAALGAATLLALPAAAQTSNTILAAPEVMDAISLNDVVSMMTELSVATQVVTADGAGPIIVATTPGGGRFLFRLSGCDNEAQAQNCSSAVVTAAQPSTGVLYDDLNAFNNEAIVTTAVNLASEQIIVFGRNIIIAGGHSRALFKGTVYLFLIDVQRFADSRANLSSVAFAPTPEKGDKILQQPGRTISVEPPTLFGAANFSPEVSAAIANSGNVDFAIEYEPAQE